MKMIFMNLVSNDLDKSRAFYTGLGFKINEQFSDDNAICVVVSETIYFMMLKPEYLKMFVGDKREVTNPATHVNQMNTISVDSKLEVDTFMNLGLSSGGSIFTEVKDQGFMYSGELQDPDGNILGFVYMDPESIN